MNEFSKKKTDQKIRRSSSPRDAISAVKLSETLTAHVDAWAEAHDTARSDAIRQLIQLGLGIKASTAASGSTHRDPHDIEDLAVRQIDQLLDPALPTQERERRIRRLTEGPPEFAEERIDLSKPKR